MPNKKSKKEVTAEKNQEIISLLSDFIFYSYERYLIPNWDEYQNNVESLYSFSKTDVFKDVTHDIIEITGIGTKSKDFFESWTSFQMLNIVFKLTASRYYTLPTSNNGERKIGELKNLSELGQKAPHAPFLQYVIKHLTTTLQCIVWYEERIKKILSETKKYSITSYEEITENYLVNNFSELTELLLESANLKNIVSDEQITQLENKSEKKIKQISHGKNDYFAYPDDKASYSIFNKLDSFFEDEEGNRSAEIITHDRNIDDKSRTASVSVSLNFDVLSNQGITFSKELTAFDQLVFDSVSTILLNKKNEAFTEFTAFQVAQLLYKSNPSNKQLEKVINSIDKMSSIILRLDNKKEIESKYKYNEFKYQAPLLPLTSVRNGENVVYQKMEAKNIETTPLLDFARQRGQVAYLPLLVIQTPIQKTELNLSIQSCLLHRIRTDKKNKTTGTITILQKTIFKEAGITESKIPNKYTLKDKKSRAKETIKNILDHWKKTECGLIDDWTEGKNGKKEIAYLIKVSKN